MVYQFGHELGHVLSNSWQPDSLPLRPSQWLEVTPVVPVVPGVLTVHSMPWARYFGLGPRI
jgi:hypothetical protein